ncbi:hypothetical protein [Streptomyces sp. NPDC007100]|uniref:hypothetical protein n=1 Tax=unclassified Streptomyces TaxID=2593676 RepID=UPI0033D0554C
MAIEVLLVVPDMRSSLASVLDRSARLREDARCYAAAAVVEARSEGAEWAEIADAAGVNEASARARWGGAKANRTLARYQQAGGGEVEPRSGLLAIRQCLGSDVLPVPPMAEEAVRRLAKALATLRRASQTELSTIAARLVLPISLVALVFEGQGLPSWPVTYMLTEAVGGSPADLRLLWERAWGTESNTSLTAPQRLPAALRGAHLVAGAPEVSSLCAEAGLDAAVVTAALEGRKVPDWDVLRELITCLGAEPHAYRALWETSASERGDTEGDSAS